MDTMNMNGHVKKNNMMSQGREQTVCIRMSDYKKIEKKILSYQTRLKAFENLQALLAKRDEDLAYYKQQVLKYENLCRQQQVQLNIYIQQHQQNGLYEPQEQRFQQEQIRLQQQRQLQQEQQRYSPPTVQSQQQYQQQPSPQQQQPSPQYKPQPSPQQPPPQYQMQPSPQQPSPQYQMQPSPQQPSPQYQMQPSPQQPSPQYQQPSPTYQQQPSPQYQQQPSPQQPSPQYPQQPSPQQPSPQASISQSPQYVPQQNGLSYVQAEYAVLQPPVNPSSQQQPGSAPRQPVMHTDIYTAALDSLVSHGLGGTSCGSDADRQLSESDVMALEHIWAEMNYPAGGVQMPQQNNDLNSALSARIFSDIQCDGEEEVSLASLKTAKTSEDKAASRPVPTTASVSEKIFKEVVRNNLRLQKSLREVASLDGTRRTKLEYERVISDLRSQLSAAEKRYEEVHSATTLLQDGETREVEDVLRSYQNKIRHLEQLVALKQSLHGMVTRQSYNQITNIPGVKDDAAQTSDVDNLTDALSQTSLSDRPVCDPAPSADTQTEATRLATEIADHQAELKVLGEEVGRLREELQKQVVELERTERKTEEEKKRLEQMEEKISDGENIRDQLNVQCKEHEVKLKALKQEMVDVIVSRQEEDQRKAREQRELEQKEIYIRQIQMYEEDSRKLKEEHEKKVASLENMLVHRDQLVKSVMDENDKLQIHVQQQRQHYQSKLAKAMQHPVPAGPVIKGPWLMDKAHRTELCQDGPPSSLSDSLGPASLKSSSLSSRTSERPREPASMGSMDAGYGSKASSLEPTHQTKHLVCPRCEREFDSTQVHYYKEHVKKCTDI